MIAALACGWLADRGATRLGCRGWIAIQACAAALILPWLPNYFDHAPEFLTPDQSLKMLAGMPIGFTGGNSQTLTLCAAVIAVGLVPMAIVGLSRRAPEKWGPSWPVVAWLVVPPLLLFSYSQWVHPLFGPSRYNVFVAPAYLILLGRGLSRLKRVSALLIGSCLILAFSIPAAMRQIYSPRKADWRGAAAWLDKVRAEAPLVVISPREGEPFELEVARFYVASSRDVVPFREDYEHPSIGVPPDAKIALFVVPTRDGQPLRPVPQALVGSMINRPFFGLRFYVLAVEK